MRLGVLLAVPAILAAAPPVDEATSDLQRAEKPVHGRTPRIDPYEHAELAVAAKQYTKAANLLRPLAAQGGGHETAQVRLAKLLLTEADAEPDAAPALHMEAAGWAARAAASGSWAAQALLADMAWRGLGMIADPVEAGKWALLVRANPERRALGADELDRTFLYRLGQRLGAAGWAQAQARADAFRAVPQPVSEAEPINGSRGS